MIANKTMIITGSSKGVGKMLCDYYCFDNNNEVYGISRTPRMEEWDSYHSILGDVHNISANDIPPADILINNAGISSMNHILTTSIDDVDKIMKTNFSGTFNMTRLVAKKMIANKIKGRIVNISTIAVPLSLEGEAVYVASKTAVEAFTKVASKEFAPFNITVNCVGFSIVGTALSKSAGKEKIDKLLQTQTIHRFADIRDIGHAIDFFIDDRADMITGQTIYLGGVF